LKYIHAGISTDHECFTLDEALEKIRGGMFILIREGSAAKNFDALSPLYNEYPEKIMLCSDDKHPNDLVNGHINQLVKMALLKGYELMDVLRSCTYNPAKHYRLDVGLLQAGDAADLIVIDNLHDFNVLETYIDGRRVAENGRSLLSSIREQPFNKFEIQAINEQDILVRQEPGLLKVQKALDGQLITELIAVEPAIADGFVISDPDRDILKIVVKNRYNEAPAAVGFISNIGLKKGAIASCVAHDSHNIIAVGADDTSIVTAINLVIGSKGGIAIVDNEKSMLLPLPFAGIMSGEDGYLVAGQYDLMDKKVKEMGSKLRAPFMTLSFMALLVIPALKLSDKGLFDGNKFSFTPLFQ
jgi:adenine deaminase